MVLIASKMGILGKNLQKIVVDVDNATLSTIEHTGLCAACSCMLPANSTLIRKIGIFFATSLAYNTIVARSMSSESSGNGR